MRIAHALSGLRVSTWYASLLHDSTYDCFHLLETQSNRVLAGRLLLCGMGLADLHRIFNKTINLASGWLETLGH